MYLRYETAPELLAQIAEAIRHDPLTWRNWTMQHVGLRPYNMDRHASPDEIHLLLQDLIGVGFYNTDSCGFLCSDGDVILMGRHVEKQVFADFSTLLGNALRTRDWCITSRKLYALQQEWQAAATLIATKGKASTVAARSPHTADSLLDGVEMIPDILEANITQRGTRQPPYVMLVEDDPVTRRIAGQLLKNDYRLVTAETAQDAIGNYLLYAPDIVFLDINLPDKSGFAVLQRILAADKDAYVVMFSSHGYLDNILTAFDYGARGFVHKPFRKEVLLHYIRDCASEHKQRANNG
jgi:two-component system chemotaxis response regulator CheY